MLVKSKLSKVYHGLLPSEILEIQIPEERFADCSNCHHCGNKNSPLLHTKCCAYHPVLPNYMIGAILSETAPHLAEGQKRTIQKIKEQAGVTPYGIIPPVKHDKLYHSQRNDTLIKPINQQVAEELRCPYYNQGACTIWSHRTELCSTFFCISSGGKKGTQFWNVFTKYFRAIEHKLTLYALLDLGYPIGKLRTEALNPQELKLDDENGIVNQELYQKLWGKWKGKEKEFFIKCYEIISKLSSRQLEDMLGLEEQILAKKIKDKAVGFNTAVIPDLLQFVPNDMLIDEVQPMRYEIEVDGERVILTNIQYSFIRSFDGKTSTYDVVRKASALHTGVSDLIEPLLKIGLLKPIR